ncbi:hypothetical protein D3C87_846700 [compost metagenome]
MAQCRFHPQSAAVAYCATCRAQFCGRCGQLEKTCSLCHRTALTSPPAAGSREEARLRCVNHPKALNTKPCHDCGKNHCPSCLNWQGVCKACAPLYSTSTADTEPSPPTRRRKSNQPELSYTGGLNRHKGWRRSLTRLALGGLILVGVGSVLAFQYGVFKDFATQAAATQKKLHGGKGGRGAADLSDMMSRLQSGDVTAADVEVTERLMARIQNGESVDTGQRDALSKLSRLYQQGTSAPAANDPQAQKLWALLSDWSNEDSDPDAAAPAIRPAAPPRPKAQVAKATPWRVSLLAPASGAKVKGLIAVNAQIEGQGYIDRVEFLVDGQWQGLSNRPPFTFDWDTTGSANGSRTLEIVAYEPSGTRHASRRVRVTVAN